MDRVNIDPSADRLRDILYEAARDANCQPSSGSYWPFRRVDAWTAINGGTDGFWQKHGRRRTLALAWWIDAAGRRHVRVVGRYRMGRSTPPPDWLAPFHGIAANAPGFRRVYGDVFATVRRCVGDSVLYRLPDELRVAVGLAGNDVLPLLVSCDWLDEHRINTAAVRQLFQESVEYGCSG